MARRKKTIGKGRTDERRSVNRAEFEIGSGNVFADLGLENSDERLAKARLAGHINEIIQRRGWNQSTAAKKLGTHQPVISALRRGRLRSITYDRLVSWLVTLGYSIEIKVEQSRRPHVEVAIA